MKEKKGEAYSPELDILVNASMGSPRMHVYPAGTGEMGAHHDISDNIYGDIREQKYFILFDLKYYKCIRLKELHTTDQ